MTKKWLVLPVFGLALVANPYLACSHSNEAYRYSEAEMKRALLGTWEGNADVDGESVDFSLVLEQAATKSNARSLATPQAQPPCTARSFVKPAAACSLVTTMPLTGTITSVNPALNGVVDGAVSVVGQDLGPATLSLRLEDGKQLAGVVDNQALSDGSITSKMQLGTFALSRP